MRFDTIRADSASRGIQGTALGLLAVALSLGEVDPALAGSSYGALGPAPSATPVTYDGPGPPVIASREGQSTMVVALTRGSSVSSGDYCTWK